MATPEPERIRWVRYAADCAERVLHLTGTARPQAEAAIKAARAWADDPTDVRLRTARRAANTAFAAASASDADAAFCATNAAGYAAAADVTYAATPAADAAYAAARADARAAYGEGSNFYLAERAWQAERREFYGLPED